MSYDQRRKELDQQIAELRAKIAAGAGDVGTASYILNGDTKLMDMASRAEQSAIEKAIQEAENEKQREFQRVQNKAARDNALEIAKMNRADVESGKIDEYQKGYNNASDLWTIAMEDLKKDPNNTTAKSAVVKWQNEMDYYGKKLGMDTDAMKAERTLAQLEQPKVGTQTSGQTVAENQKSFDEIMKGPWNNATKAEATYKAMSNTDPSAQEVQLQSIKNKGLTYEEKKALNAAEDSAANRKFSTDGTYDSKKYKVKYVKGVATLVRK